MKYNRKYLIEELERFIKENSRYPIATDLRVKNGYPSINAYKETFGSFSNAIYEFENNKFPIQQVDVNLLDKYTLICENEIYKLWLKYPNISIETISDIMQIGYNCGITAESEAVELEILKDLYL